MRFEFPKFALHPGMRYGLSNRKDGSMHRHLETEARERYFRSIGIDPLRVVTADLMHGSRTVRVQEEMAGTMIPDVDGLATDLKNTFLSVTVADCFPIYLYDPARPAVGIAHAGWRGTLKGIVPSTVQLMEEDFGTDPDLLLAGIGPGIRSCHFSIDPADEELYAGYSNHVSKRGYGVHVDLAGIIKEQLLKRGLKEENIADSGLCTFCEAEEYFSYRRDKPPEVEPMVAHIGLA